MNMEISLPRGVKHNPRGVILPAGMTYEQWMDYGRFLGKCRGSVAFWEADWLRFGRKEYGEDKVQAAAVQLELDLGTIRAIEAINSLELRSPDLSTEHHFVLAKAKMEKRDQERWIATATKERLTAKELQESISAGEVRRHSVGNRPGRHAGLATIQGIRMQWELLLRAIGDEWKKWSEEDTKTFLEECGPILDFCEELKRRIS